MRRINYISVLRYVQRITAAREFTGLTFSCDSDELLAGSACPFTTGEQILTLYSFEPSVLQDTIIVLALAVAYRIAGCVLLAIFARRRVLQQ